MRFRIPAVLLFCASATAPGSSVVAEGTSDKGNAERLAEALRGRTAGRPVTCLRAERMEVIDDWTILIRNGGTVYLQKPEGGCPGLDGRGYTLVSRQAGQHQLCQGDIQQLVNLNTGVEGGSCVLGPFIPYRKSG